MKKLLAGIVAVLIAVSASSPALAATTVAQGETNSITVSSYFSKQSKTLTMKDPDGSTESEQDTVYEVPAGAVVALSQSGSMIYAAAKQDSDGSYITSGELGVIDSSYTIPASMVDKTLFFIGEEEPLVFVCHVVQNATYRSDTTVPLFIGQGSSYQFKITSLNGKKPTFAVGGNGFKYTYVKCIGSDYYYRITAIGSNGTCCGVYVNGGRIPCCTATVKNIVKSDTGKKLTVKAGKTYQFKITSNCGKPRFVCGTPSVFTVKYNGQKGNDYFFIVKAVGKTGQCAGFYMTGTNTVSTVGTIA